MRKISRSILSLLLAALMVFSFTACKADENTTEKEEREETANTVVTSEHDLYAELLPEKDYGGRDFKIITLPTYNLYNHLIYDEYTTDAIDAVAYERTCFINEKYGVRLTLTEDEFLYNTVTSSHSVGDKEWDLIYPHPTSGIVSLMTSGCFADLGSFEYLHLDREWWNQSQVTNYQTNGKLYVGVSDYTMTGQGIVSLIYNKDMYRNLELDANVFDTVMNGKWTMEKLAQMVTKASSSDAGNDTSTYGMSYHIGYTNRWMYGMGATVLTKDESNQFVLAFDNMHMTKIGESLYALLNNSGNVYMENLNNAEMPNSELWKNFKNGNALFMTFDIGVLYGMISDISFEVDYLPLPKLDEEQKDYHVICAGGIIAIPAIAADTEMSSIILEALSIYSCEYLKPAFYNKILNGKLADFPEKAEMLEFLHSKKFFDVGYTLDTKGDAIFMLQRCVIDDERPAAISGYIRSNKGALNDIANLANTIE